MDTGAGLDDVLARPLALISIFGAEEGGAGAGGEFREEVPDFREVLRRTALVHDIGHELAELVDLEQRGRLARQCGDEPCPRGQAFAAQMRRQAPLDEDLLDHLPSMILAAATLGDTENIDVGAQIALGSHLASHEGTQRRQSSPDRKPGLRADGCDKDVVHQKAERTIQPVERGSGRNNQARGIARLRDAPHTCADLCQQRRRRMHVCLGGSTIQHKPGIRLPAALHGEMIDRARPDSIRLERRPVPGREGIVILGGLGRPEGEELFTRITQGALERKPDADPAIIVQLSVGNECQRCANGRHGTSLGVRGGDSCRPSARERHMAHALR